MYLPAYISDRLICLSAWFYLRDTRKIGKNLYQLSGNIKFFLRNNTADTYIKWEVFNNKTYLAEGFGIQSSDTVVDIGAHIGIFAVYAAKMVSKGVVLAYEPNPDNFLLLQENKTLNNLSNLKIFNKAVTSKGGEIDLYFSKYNTGGHSVFQRDSSNKIKVPAVSLENVFKENNLKKVDYLKIDIEGSEFDIIFNSPKSIFITIDKIVLEYHDFYATQYKHKDLQKYLESLGYEVSVHQLIWDKLLKTGTIFAKRKNAT